jgi:hypothetical protein
VCRSKLDGKAPEGSDYANYFCTYAYLYHQVITADQAAQRDSPDTACYVYVLFTLSVWPAMPCRHCAADRLDVIWRCSHSSAQSSGLLWKRILNRAAAAVVSVDRTRATADTDLHTALAGWLVWLC